MLKAERTGRFNLQGTKQEQKAQRPFSTSRCLQSPNNWQRQTEDRNVSENIDDSGSQVESILVDTGTLRVRQPELFYRIALESKGEEIRKEYSGRNEGNDHSTHSKTGSSLKYSPVEQEDANFD